MCFASHSPSTNPAPSTPTPSKSVQKFHVARMLPTFLQSRAACKGSSISDGDVTPKESGASCFMMPHAREINRLHGFIDKSNHCPLDERERCPCHRWPTAITLCIWYVTFYLLFFSFSLFIFFVCDPSGLCRRVWEVLHFSLFLYELSCCPKRQN